MSDKEFPKPEEIQKEFEDFVKKRFGGQVKIIAQEIPQLIKDQEQGSKSGENADSLKFDMKPKDLKAYLDRFVIGQDEAKKALCIAVCDHYNQVLEHFNNPELPLNENYMKQNVLILGPTGVGKTYMIRQIAKLIGVPFVKADATRFSETGYVGANVDDLIKDLVQQANGKIQKAQCGIVYLDEADKLASPNQSHGGRDVSGRGVQMGLLKLMEETDVDLKAGHDPASQMQAFLEMQQKGKIERQVVNTRHILFIVSGAFTNLSDLISKRLHKNKIGFDRTERISEETNLLQLAVTQDFVDYGFEPEFIGRLPVRVACNLLDEKTMFAILNDSEGSILRQFVSAFNHYGIELSFSEKALRLIASKAVQEKTGARGLMTILERILRDYKFYLPSTDILNFEVTEEVVEKPKEFLENLLASLQEDRRAEIKLIKDFERHFFNEHGMKISFDNAAVQFLIRRSREEGSSADKLCQEILQSYEHGLKLIQQNTGRSEFLIDENIVKHPRQALEKMVKDSYNLKSEPEHEN